MIDIKALADRQTIIMGMVLSAFAFSLSACNESKEEEVAVAPIQEAVKDDTSIILSEGSVGPIKADTAFNLHKIKLTTALNQYGIVEESLKGNVSPIIRITEGVNTIMSIIPDATHKGIYSVIVEDNIVKNSLGHPLGTLYSNIYAYGQHEQCQLGVEDMSGKVMCYAPKYPNILYVFNDNIEGLVNVMPPADVLQGWALESIIWRPKQ